MKKIKLYDIASARSGDKGSDANVGIWTDTEARYEFLRKHLTADRVKAHFQALVRGPVDRFEMPNIRAFNFILHNALDGGAAASLRTDAQGKTLSLGLLQMTLEVPEELAP